MPPRIKRPNWNGTARNTATYGKPKPKQKRGAPRETMTLAIDNARPPYLSTIPLMRDHQRAHLARMGIERLPVAVSTFSGCGGSCLGLEWAGFHVAWANEFIPIACESYSANHPFTQLDSRDIREVSAKQILESIHLEVGELDLLEGSPPCSAFSIGGLKEAGWNVVKPYSTGGTTQRVDDLFWEYTRLLKDLQPKMFVAENVEGLTLGASQTYFEQILNALAACGYTVECRKINAARLGVPQERKRMIFMGLRNDLAQSSGLRPQFPAPLPYTYTVQDAWEGLVDPGPHYTLDEGSVTRRCWELARPGQAFDEVKQRVNGSKGMFSHEKIRLNAPSPTIPRAQDKYHPTEPRTLGVHEVARLCGFPDDFVTVGSFLERWERFGRAVPPPMYRALGHCITEVLCQLPNH